MEQLKLLASLEEKLNKNPDDLATAKYIAKIYKDINPSINHATHYLAKMYQDEKRNEFYAKIIEEKVKDKNVLEIGTGLGLVAFYILQQKPKNFLSCELNLHSFRKASEFFMANKLSDKIQLLNKSSFDIFYTEDINFKFDYIVHELFASNPFAEGFLPTLYNAKRLLAIEGKFLPGIFRLMAHPVQVEDHHFDNLKKELTGLDTSCYDNYYAHKLIDLNKNIKILKKYNPISIFEIDLNEDFKFQDMFSLKANDLNDANALIFYFQTQEGEHILSNYDDGKANFISDHWGAGLFMLDMNNPRDIQVKYDRTKLHITA